MSIFKSLRGWLIVLVWLATTAPLGVFVGVQLEDSHAPEVLTAQIKSSGGMAISADELIQRVRTEKRVVFWVGRRDGDYSFSHYVGRRKIDQIDYLPSGALTVGSKSFDFSVTTFGNQKTYQTQLRPLAPGSKSTFISPSGALIMYDLSWPYYCVVNFPSEPYVVRIEFSTRQTPQSLITMAEHLLPIPA